MSNIQCISTCKIDPAIPWVESTYGTVAGEDFVATYDEFEDERRGLLERIFAQDDFATIEVVIDAPAAHAIQYAKFKDLVRQWRNERGAKSSVAEMVMLPSYQKIMAMGPDAIPFILAELKAEDDAPDHWFWALAAIAYENPVPPESRGRLTEMAKAWIEWGQKAGYV